MEKTSLDTAILDATAREAGRSSLFLWLRDNYQDVLDSASGGRLDWLVIAEKCEARGLTDATGKPAKPEVVRRTWYRVKNYMAKHPAPKTVARPANPSRTPVSWTPPLAAATPRIPVAPRPATIRPPAPAGPVNDADHELTGDDQIDRVMAQLRERSNRRNGIF